MRTPEKHKQVKNVAHDLLTKLTGQGIHITADGNELVVEGPPNLLTDDVVACLRKHKPALLALLRLPPGWPPDVAPPANWPALRAMDWLEVLKARPTRCPDCGFQAGILWRREEDPLPRWSCPACCATLPPRDEDAEAFRVAELLEHADFNEADQPEPDAPQHPPEWAEARQLSQRWRQARERLIELLRAEGERRGWPGVRIAPWSELLAGRESWEAFLRCPVHGPDEYDRLLEALSGNKLNTSERTQHEAT